MQPKVSVALVQSSLAGSTEPSLGVAAHARIQGPVDEGLLQSVLKAKGKEEAKELRDLKKRVQYSIV